MYRKLVVSLCFLLFTIATVAAQDDEASTTQGPANSSATASAPSSDGLHGSGDSDAKLVRGMSVLGNDEAPMSLFIVPWKSSELGVETSLSRTLNEQDVPVDRDVFLREVDFYQVSVGGKKPAAAVSQISK